ncbi:MATE family efflux transporter, partial [Dolichospermum circinale CS-537/05]|nr:MATE family efflux transporter [Dolichospermum circinale CS-537/05]
AILLVGLRNGTIALVLGILIVVLQYPLREIGFSLLSGEFDVKAAGIEYFNTRIWGAPAVLLNFVLIGWLLGREKSGQVLILSAIGNLANMVLDYLFIILWGWDSMGAGISQASSQYLMLFTGLFLSRDKFTWEKISKVSSQLMNLENFKSTVSLNRDILLRTITELSVYTVFSNLSAGLGTVIFTQNSLLAQIINTSVYLTNGFGFATETLSGNSKGQNAQSQFIPILRISVFSSLTSGIIISAICVFFPEVVFGILTNHTEITEDIHTYAWWLFLVIGFTSVAAILEGHFLGLTEGKIVRNVSFISTGLAFIPSVIVILYFHDNHFLWLGLVMFQLVKMSALLIYLPKTLSSDVDDEVETVSIPVVE